MSTEDSDTYHVNIPIVGIITGTTPIVVIGPNGAGKTRVMRNISAPDRFIAAQRRTVLNPRLPNYEEEIGRKEFLTQLNNARNQPWEFTNEIDALFSTIVQQHYAELYRDDEAAREGKRPRLFVNDSPLAKLIEFWEKVFPNTRLTFKDFSPRAIKRDATQSNYAAREMSDGERSCLYLAARVFMASSGYLFVDEPELHLHKKLAVDYWNQLERMRPDIRFIYITHDLHFALSRENPTVLVVRENGFVERASVETLPNDLAEVLLGAATLTVSASRIVFYEGINGKGVASKLMKTWVNSPGSVAIAAGNCQEVLAASTSFTTLGLLTAVETVGLIDRDHGPEEFHSALKPPAFVLKFHEIESLFALPGVIRSAASVIGYDGDPWPKFLERAKKSLQTTRSKTVAERVRARTDHLLRRLFNKDQIRPTVEETMTAHQLAVGEAGWPDKILSMFLEEDAKIEDALQKSDETILIYLSGKKALSDASTELNLTFDAYCSLVIAAISSTSHQIHTQVVSQMELYLPPR
ncbi:ABC-type cobalamin/Fe3+-siderophores transport system ATPase subunit [Tahibacter aquaticus]|uniref:ABC-type cobalamin/Fe3+-siderophores transport system ATPase subunit n=1 Tax=Tahibacter aquaticus TaxID=520092 RepID=A0A4R6YH20_9GAMM|nr:AAA family ATPase [Tahibacter aquaticus]TDR35770.1 ABC-type cobalamin/Fe3+-siderophores transport system ATPase subunit [Tahibacter aquaticus]